MSDQITTTGTGNNATFNVYYGAENRQKRIEWVSGSCSVNKLYSALQNLFDELGQMDDGVPMSAQTPVEYTVGIIDAGDKDPWFIDRTTVEKLTGGAIKTASWNRVVGTNTGIVRMAYTQTVALVAGDIGKDVLMTVDGDRGTLLDYNDTGATKYMWIRPDSSAAANSFDDAPTGNGAWTIVGGRGTGNQAGGTATTGESVWANIFSIGTIETNTHLYIRQGTGLLNTYKALSLVQDWWSDGHIDILVNVKELGTENDEGVIQVFARQHSKTYDHFEVDLNTTTGGRNPIPLSTGNDLDNQFGWRKFTGSAGTGTFVVGEVISKSGTDKKGVLTKVEGTGAAPILTYYLIGDPLVDFALGDTSVTGATSLATCTAGTPADENAALLTTVVITHGFSTAYDINENDATERYSIVVTRSDAGTFTLNQYQQRFKYITRRGETSTASTDGLAGQFYIGSDLRINYDTQTGNFAEGLVVTGGTSGAKGTIVADHDSGATGFLILRNTRGTFVQNESITDSVTGAAEIVDLSTAVRILAPVKASPFGIYAGGKFFGAPGVVIDPTDITATDASNYQLIDDDGNVVKPPTKVVLTIGNTVLGDKLAAFRLTGALGDLQKDYYSATVQAIGAITVVVGEAIRVDEPGKTSEGILRLVDNNADPTLTKEYRLRFNTWSASTFNLFEFDATPAGAGTTTTNVNFAGVGTYAKIGDLVLNITRSNAVSYVTAIVDANNVTISPAITGQTSTDNIKLNYLPVATTTADDVYVPFIDSYETADGSETVTITYNDVAIPIRVRARRSGSLPTPIVPFEQDSTITSTGATVNVIRTPDTIFTP